MNISKERVEAAWGLIEKLGEYCADPVSVIWDDARALYLAVRERDARIKELEAGQDATCAGIELKKLVVARADTSPWAADMSPMWHLGRAEALLEERDHFKAEADKQKELADFYRADAYNSDVEGMRREDKIVNLLAEIDDLTPSEGSRARLMEICQDQGEFKVRQRVDQLVSAYGDFEIYAERLKDNISKLEKDAANYRIKIGKLEISDPDAVVDASLVPDWVSKKVDPTRWDVIARHQPGGRVLIGVSYYFVHSRSTEDFKNRDACWADVLDSAVHFLPEGWKDEPTDASAELVRLKKLLEVSNDQVEHWHTWARRAEANEEQQRESAKAFKALYEGLKLVREHDLKRVCDYIEGMAQSSLKGASTAGSALTQVVTDLRRGTHKLEAHTSGVVATRSDIDDGQWHYGSFKDYPKEPVRVRVMSPAIAGFTVEHKNGRGDWYSTGGCGREHINREFVETGGTVTLQGGSPEAGVGTVTIPTRIWVPGCDCGLSCSACMSDGHWEATK
jgi:hypothetical protein